ncbi:ribonuclease R [Kiloniella sp. b19]|uniref:ribonuclease R n=1 Tax=Kiloniella sp. GXU_MW_B19 TaxID=3141326 RepID=UPI0031D47FDB
MAGPKGKGEEPYLPTEAEVLEFIQQSPTRVGKREIAKAFNLKGQDRIHLKAILRRLKDQGLFGKRPEESRVLSADSLPPVLVVVAQGLDRNGEMIALPQDWPAGRENPPILYMVEDRRKGIVLAEGERALAKIKPIGKRQYEALPIRRIHKDPARVLGIYEQTSQGGRIRSVDKRSRDEFVLKKEHALGAEPNELVLAEPLGNARGRGPKEVKVVERLGAIDNPRALSLVAIYEHQIPNVFPEDALKQADEAQATELGNRTDLRDIPLVTIDGADARDFDDAVWAEPDSDPDNPGGWHALVAIADVSHYVTLNSPLDMEARNRGNSTYFADRVVPMLPEVISNGWCSLVPDEERPCMAVHLWISADGNLIKHRFVRGLMRSAARLTYEQVQEALNGFPDETTAPLMESVLSPLLGTFKALEKARSERGTLELEIPEFRPVLDEDGDVVAVEKRQRLDSHKLIEELMITANVAAATELETTRIPCIYRVHETPDPVKIEALAASLKSMDLPFAKGQVITPKVLSRVLDRASERPEYPMISELVLRSQSQALYTCENAGHFGLALQRYAHFTSPIRRYADLMVHRAIIRKNSLGSDGLPDEAFGTLEEIAELISGTERRSALAERDTNNRFTAVFMSRHVGEVFAGKVNGVTKAGLFITLDNSGADGLLPMRYLPEDYYHHNEESHQLVGKRWGRVFSLGDKVAVRVFEANAVAGSITFELVEHDEGETTDRPKRNVRSSTRSNDRKRTSGRSRKKTPGTAPKRSFSSKTSRKRSKTTR